MTLRFAALGLSRRWNKSRHPWEVGKIIDRDGDELEGPKETVWAALGLLPVCVIKANPFPSPPLSIGTDTFYGTNQRKTAGGRTSHDHERQPRGTSFNRDGVNMVPSRELAAAADRTKVDRTDEFPSSPPVLEPPPIQTGCDRVGGLGREDKVPLDTDGHVRDVNEGHGDIRRTGRRSTDYLAGNDATPAVDWDAAEMTTSPTMNLASVRSGLASVGNPRLGIVVGRGLSIQDVSPPQGSAPRRPIRPMVFGSPPSRRGR